MAVLQMQRMNLVAMKQNRKAILERLQEIGSLEIDVKAEDYAGTMQLDTAGMRAVFEKRAASADRALAILDEYVPEEKGLLSSFAGKPLVDCSELDEVIGKQQEYLAQIASVLSYEKQIGEDRATIQKLENQLEMLMPWKALDIPMNVSGTDKTTLLIGTIPEQVTEEIVLTALKTHQPPVDAAEVEIIKVERDATYLSVL